MKFSSSNSRQKLHHAAFAVNLHIPGDHLIDAVLGKFELDSVLLREKRLCRDAVLARLSPSPKGIARTGLFENILFRADPGDLVFFENSHDTENFAEMFHFHFDLCRS